MSTHNILIFRRLQACADLSAQLYFFMTVFVYENAELFLTMYTTYGGNYLKIQESAENYLETILMLSEKQPYVRSIDRNRTRLLQTQRQRRNEESPDQQPDPGK